METTQPRKQAPPVGAVRFVVSLVIIYFVVHWFGDSSKSIKELVASLPEPFSTTVQYLRVGILSAIAGYIVHYLHVNRSGVQAPVWVVALGCSVTVALSITVFAVGARDDGWMVARLAAQQALVQAGGILLGVWLAGRGRA